MYNTYKSKQSIFLAYIIWERFQIHSSYIVFTQQYIIWLNNINIAEKTTLNHKPFSTTEHKCIGTIGTVTGGKRKKNFSSNVCKHGIVF